MNPVRNGFSLVEIMVGLAMGMIAMVVVMQVFAVFEGGKRTTTGSADAQTNGAVALYMIERDTRIAGWGMDAQVYSQCNTTYSYCDGSASCGGVAGPLGDFATASVLIHDGGTGADTITAQYFTDPTVATYKFPGSTTLRGSMSSAADNLNVTSLSGCQVPDLVLVQQAGQCTVMKISPPADDTERKTLEAALQLKHAPGTGGEYNPPADYLTANSWPVYTTGAVVSCFTGAANGPLFQRTYSINANHQLTLGGQVVANEIVDLQAQYGIAAAGSQDVNDWVAPTGQTWGNPTSTDRKRIKAVRIALVARSTQYEKPVNGVCKTTTPEMVAAWSSWAGFNTANYPADWQCYRYKVFETVVPLRNIIMGNI
ncbi:MAG TPA: PilW family protein [Noviherbaspirillum sp.]|uniref:PilW family protein n=1 Tax=Noviherbaspirillum sp. TaxID=1926288 RepID=UPI002B4A7C91|nr:PilW family protein [Noviherbaspirillum sp.]HJV85921.1 PilW family protein [Noviherbaspirillum sp.]